MKKINLGQSTKKRYGFKLWGSALAGAIAVVAIVLLVLPSTPDNKSTNQTQTIANSKVSPDNNKSSESKVAVLPAGSDNTSLDNDLNSIQSEIGQENNDQSSANNGLNDNQQEITVPTD